MNAHTNQMTEAFKQAGVKPAPLSLQLWNIVKEQQGATHADIRKRATHIPLGSIATTLHSLEKRCMIYSRPADIKNPRTKAYFTDMERYELLPLPREPKVVKDTAKPAPIELMTSEQTITNVVTKAATPSQDWLSYVDALTIGQARGLYQHLHKMFGA